jgi:hypothetical protein
MSGWVVEVREALRLREALDLIPGGIPLQQLVEEAARVRLAYVRYLERYMEEGEEVFACPWDRVPLLRGRLPRYRLVNVDWGRRDWGSAGCDHFRLFFLRKADPRARRLRWGGRWLAAVAESESFIYIIARRRGGLGAPWKP